MNEWQIYALSCIWGGIDKLGDDAIDIYHAKHGTMFMEFGKIVRLVVIFVLLFIPQNIWLYLFILMMIPTSGSLFYPATFTQGSLSC